MNNVTANDRLSHFLQMIDYSFPGIDLRSIELKSTDLSKCQLISPQMSRRLFDDWVDAGLFVRHDTSTPNRPQFTYSLSVGGLGWYDRQTIMQKWVSSARVRGDLKQRTVFNNGELDQGIVLSLTPQQKKLF